MLLAGSGPITAAFTAVAALQLQERRAGNSAYQQEDYAAALKHYQRALAVVNFVVGQTPHDQAEIQQNKATVLLNMAAAHMALKVCYCRSNALHIPSTRVKQHTS